MTEYFHFPLAGSVWVLCVNVPKEKLNTSPCSLSPSKTDIKETLHKKFNSPQNSSSVPFLRLINTLITLSQTYTLNSPVEHQEFSFTITNENRINKNLFRRYRHFWSNIRLLLLSYYSVKSALRILLGTVHEVYKGERNGVEKLKQT